MSSVPTTSNKRIAKNTIFLYFRMIFNILLQFYTVPVVLRVLGTEDYGLYNVIGGITILFSFLGGSMVSGVNRFLAFAIGENDQEKLNKVYNTTYNIYVVITIIAVIAFEIGGNWFIYNKMIIPDGRLVAALIIFQFTIITFVFDILNIPAESSLVAHECLDIYAYLSIVASILKLVVVILIQFISYDHLITYTFLLLLVSVGQKMFLRYYCAKKFEECRNYKWNFDKDFTKELIVYSGYNMIGYLASVLRQQGLNLLMNVYYGTLLNAAHGIANSINNVINSFVGNIYMAARPQITKYFAVGNLEGMWTLVYRTSLLSFYLVLVIAIPISIELQPVLDLWLHDVPEYTVNIARAFFICLLIETSTQQLIYVFQAENKIKAYQLSSSMVLIFNIPVAYIALKINSDNPLLPYYVQISFSLLFVLMIFIVSIKELGLDYKYFVRYVLMRELFIATFVAIILSFISSLFSPSLLRVVITSSSAIIITGLLVLFMGFNKDDKTIILSMIKSRLKKK